MESIHEMSGSELDAIAGGVPQISIGGPGGIVIYDPDNPPGQ